MKRDGKSESMRLHRAKRAAERAALDAALAAADACLAKARSDVMTAMVKLSVQHPVHSVHAAYRALCALEDARLALRKHFDEIGSNE